MVRMRWLLLRAILLLTFLSLIVSAYIRNFYVFGASISLVALLVRSLFTKNGA